MKMIYTMVLLFSVALGLLAGCAPAADTSDKAPASTNAASTNK